MTSSRARHPKVRPSKVSIRRRLLVGGLAAFVSALQIYLANIPRTIDLPQDDVDAHTFARADNERIEIDAPTVSKGELLLSYAGRRGEVVDLHFDNAIIDASSASLQPALKPLAMVPARIAYVSLPPARAKPGAPALPGGDTCHTSVEIRRAVASPPITTVNAFLLNGTANNEQHRELRVWTDGADLDVSIHTDPPPTANGEQVPFDTILGCSKLLQVRPLKENGPEAGVDVPLIQTPIHLVVPNGAGQKSSNPANLFRISFTSALDGPSLTWRSADDLFEGISLGNTSLEAKQVRVLPLRAENGERLKVRAEGDSALTLDRLQFSLNALKIGVSGPASVEIDGKRLGFDLMRFLKQNPILSGVLALLNAAILLLVKETFFPRLKDQPDEDQPDEAD